ncbi:MAG: glycosyltransferase family 39 protein [Actinomycetota bacterium]|nr:glycosyltransferase family 39 protein [Actinomycetota bacterium]
MALLAMTLLFGARAGWWVANSEVPTPVDEGAHYAYIQSLAEGHYPVTGEDQVGVDAITLVKGDRANVLRSLSYPSKPSAAWGLIDQQYEAFQPPIYYLVSVPVYAAARSISLVAALYALRIWTVLLVASAVPLLYLAGRELFAEQPAVWLLAPLLLTGVEMVASSLAQVTNDAIMVPLGAAALWALGRYFNAPRVRRAAVVGISLGLAVLGKTTAVALIGAAVVALTGLLVGRSGQRRQILLGGAVAGMITMAIITPWLLLNLHQYHALTGIGANGKLVLPLTGRLARSAGEVRSLATLSRETLWAPQVGAAHRVGYSYIWEWTAAVTVLGGVAAATIRRQVARAATILWLASIAPLGFALLVWSLFTEADGIGAILGRHLAVTLPALCLAMAAGAVQCLSTRVATVGALGVLTATSSVAVTTERSYLASTYASPVFGRTVPTVDQSWSDSSISVTALQVTSSCNTGFIGVATPQAGGALVAAGVQPPRVSVEGMALSRAGADQNFAVYRLAAPRSGTFTVTFASPVVVERSLSHQSAGLDFIVPPAAGSPTVRLYCPTSDPAAARFALLEHPDHLAISYGTARGWPLVGPLAYGAGTMVAMIFALRALRGRRGLRQHSGAKRTDGRPKSGV